MHCTWLLPKQHDPSDKWDTRRIVSLLPFIVSSSTPYTLTTSPIQQHPRHVQFLLLRYFRMEAAEDVACDQGTGVHDLRESIVAIDVRDKKTMGCSIFSTTDGVLKIANDVPMVNENVAEQFLNFAQATTILMSRRVPETLLTFVEKHVERNANGKHFPVHSALI